jgi:hypothetical protein
MNPFLDKVICSLSVVCLFAGGVHAQALHPARPSRAGSTPSRPSDHLNESLPDWMKVNGEFRVRLEGISGGGYRPNADDAYTLSRVRLNFTLSPQPWLRTVFQAQDAQVMGRNPKPDGPPYEDTFDLRQAYVELGRKEGNTFELRVGRQEFVFGEQRLVGHVSWLNTARSFDAVRAAYRHKDFRIDAFASSVVNVREAEFNRHTDGNNFHGVHGSFTSLVPRATVEPYVFWRLSRGLKSEAGISSKLDFKTVGFRWVGKLPANFDYGVEMATQTGSLGPDDVQAWGGHWLAGYTVAKPASKPRVFAEYNFATGDANPTDQKREGFDQLYPTPHDKTGLADQVGWKNIHHVRGGLELKPTAKLSASTSYHSWWLANAHDGLYGVSGALVAKVADGSAGRHVGQEVDVQASYPLSPQIQIAPGYSHIFPGTFLKKASPGKAFNFAYVMLTYQF